MRIGIDAHAVGSKLGGNETYMKGLLAALGRIESPHEFVAYFASEEAAEEWRERYDNMDVRVFRSRRRLPRLLGELPMRAAADRLDLLHVQAIAPPVSFVPVVATIHDICYEFHPELFERSEARQLRIAIRRTARTARRVVAVSETTKRDISAVYGVPPEKIDVSHNGVDLKRFHPQRSETEKGILERYGIEAPYVLAVGNLQPRKNLVRLIDAFVHLKRVRPKLPCRIVVVGKAAFRHSEIFARARECGIGDQIVFTGYVSDGDLPALYRGAVAFAYPSLYEGFGLPVAEAMACGVPVLTSDRGSLPEVVGDAALIVDPESTHAIARGLSRILTEPELSAELSRKGPERTRDFTWDNAARTTLAAFTAAAEKGDRS